MEPPTRRGFNKVKKVLPPPGFKQENKNAMLWVQKKKTKFVRLVMTHTIIQNLILKNIVEQKGKEMHKHVEYRHQPSHNLCQKRRNSKQKQTYEANNIAHGTQLMVEKKMDKELEDMGGIKHHQRCCGQGGQGVGGDG